MKLFLKIVVGVFAFLGISLATLIGLICIPSVQQQLKTQATNMLSDELGTKVGIDSISLSLTKGSIAVYGFELEDRQGESMLNADTLYGQMKMIELLNQRIDITDIKLSGTKANLYKEKKDSAANYQFVLDTFKKDKKDKSKKKKLSFDISNVLVSNTELHWEIKSDDKSKVDAKLRVAGYNRDNDLVTIQGLEGLYDKIKVTLKSIEFGVESKNALLSELKATDRGNTYSIGSIECDSLKYFNIDDFRIFTNNDLPRKNAGKHYRGAFDPGHMKVVGNLKFTALSTQKDNIILHIDKLWAEDKESGLIVDSMSCYIKSDMKSAKIEKLFVKDQHTIVSMPEVTITGLQASKKKADKGEEFHFTTSQFYAKTQLADIAKPFGPALVDFTTPLEVTAYASGNTDRIDFKDINASSLDKRLKIKATGYIDSLLSKTRLLVHFDINSMSARNGIKEQIINHFPIKQSMMGILHKIGNIGFVGSVEIPFKKQTVEGKLLTEAGAADFNILMDNTTRYVKGRVSSDSINVGKIIANNNMGNISFEGEFKFDIAGRRSAKKLGRKVDKLPAGYAKGIVHEARHRNFVLRDTYFNIDSDGKLASGNVRVASGILDLICSFSFSDTNFPKSLKVKPSVKFHKMSEAAKERRAAKKAQKQKEKEAKRKEKEERKNKNKKKEVKAA